MTFVCCPNCGLVYVKEYAYQCESRKCQESSTWIPPMLEPIQGQELTRSADASGK